MNGNKIVKQLEKIIQKQSEETNKLKAHINNSVQSNESLRQENICLRRFIENLEKDNKYEKECYATQINTLTNELNNLKYQNDNLNMVTVTTSNTDDINNIKEHFENIINNKNKDIVELDRRCQNLIRHNIKLLETHNNYKIKSEKEINNINKIVEELLSYNKINEMDKMDGLNNAKYAENRDVIVHNYQKYKQLKKIDMINDNKDKVIYKSKNIATMSDSQTASYPHTEAPTIIGELGKLFGYSSQTEPSANKEIKTKYDNLSKIMEEMIQENNKLQHRVDSLTEMINVTENKSNEVTKDKTNACHELVTTMLSHDPELKQKCEIIEREYKLVNADLKSLRVAHHQLTDTYNNLVNKINNDKKEYDRLLEELTQTKISYHGFATEKEALLLEKSNALVQQESTLNENKIRISQLEDKIKELSRVVVHMRNEYVIAQQNMNSRITSYQHSISELQKDLDSMKVYRKKYDALVESNKKKQDEYDVPEDINVCLDKLDLVNLKKYVTYVTKTQADKLDYEPLYKELADEYVKLQNQNDKLKNQVSQLTQKFSGFLATNEEQANSNEAKINELKAQLANLEKDKLNLQHDVEKLATGDNATICSLNQQIKNNEDIIGTITSEHEELIQAYQKLFTENDDLKAQSKNVASVIDELENKIDMLSDNQNNNFKSQIDTVQDKLNDQIAQNEILRNQNTQLTHAVGGAETVISELNTKVSILTKNNDDYLNEVQHLDDEIDALLETNSKLNISANNLHTENANLRTENDTLHTDNANLDIDLTEYRTENNKLNEAIDQLNIQIDNLKNENNGNKDEISDLETKLNECKFENDKLRVEVDKLSETVDAQKKNLQNKIYNMTTYYAQSRELLFEKDNLTKLNNELQTKVTDTETKLNSITSDYSQLKAEVTKLNSTVADMELQYEQKIKVLANETQHYMNALHNYKNECDNLTRENRQLADTIADYKPYYDDAMQKINDWDVVSVDDIDNLHSSPDTTTSVAGRCDKPNDYITVNTSDADQSDLD
jgi:chromosome segregation ATPase